MAPSAFCGAGNFQWLQAPSAGRETFSGSKRLLWGGKLSVAPSAFSGPGKLPVAPRVPSPGRETSSGSKSAFSGAGNFQWLDPSAFCGVGNFQWHQAPSETSSGSKRLLRGGKLQRFARQLFTLVLTRSQWFVGVADF